MPDCELSFADLCKRAARLNCVQSYTEEYTVVDCCHYVGARIVSERCIRINAQVIVSSLSSSACCYVPITEADQPRSIWVVFAEASNCSAVSQARYALWDDVIAYEITRLSPKYVAPVEESRPLSTQANWGPVVRHVHRKRTHT